MDLGLGAGNFLGIFACLRCFQHTSTSAHLIKEKTKNINKGVHSETFQYLNFKQMLHQICHMNFLTYFVLSGENEWNPTRSSSSSSAPSYISHLFRQVLSSLAPILVFFVHKKFLPNMWPKSCSFIVDQWSPCSASCGEGIRFRKVSNHLMLSISNVDNIDTIITIVILLWRGNSLAQGFSSTTTWISL